MKTKRVSIVSKPGKAPVPDLRRRVVGAARELFLGRGFVRVTADDIAAELGISKATLYREFASKEEILRAVVRDLMTEISGEVGAIMGDDRRSLIERLVALFTFVANRLSRFGPVFIRDIQKSAPAVWAEIEDFRRNKLVSNFKTVLAAGHGQGLIRGDIDDELMMRMLLKLVEEFVNPGETVRTGRPPSETFQAVIKVFFQGILTDKGRSDFKECAS